MIFSSTQVKELIAVAVGATIMMNALVAGYVQSLCTYAMVQKKKIISRVLL